MNANIDGRSSVELDRERVTCLLLINTQLMKKAIGLHNRFFVNQNNLNQLPPQAKQSIMESFQNCNRRLHCNLTVLSYIHERYQNEQGLSQQSPNKNSFPVIMAPPQDMPELNQLYLKLQELYPEGLQFLKLKLQQMRKQQQSQSQQSPLLPQLHNTMQGPQGLQNNPQHVLLAQQPGPSPHMVQMAPQRQISQVLQNSMLPTHSPVLNAPGVNQVQNSSINSQMLKDNNSGFHPQQNQRQYQGEFNTNYATNMNIAQQGQPQMHMNSQQLQNGPSHQQQPPRPQGISPQQIFLQMNNNGDNSSGGGMMDFFNV